MKRQVVTTKRKGIRFEFISEIISELRKVTWPSREEAVRLTIMVIAFSMAVGIILGIIDYGFSRLINSVLLRGG